MIIDFPTLLSLIDCIFVETYNPFYLLTQFTVSYFITSTIQFFFPIEYPLSFFIVGNYIFYRFYFQSPLEPIYQCFQYRNVNMEKLQNYQSLFMSYLDSVLIEAQTIDDPQFVALVMEINQLLLDIINSNGNKIQWKRLLTIQQKIINHEDTIYYMRFSIENINNNELLKIQDDLENNFISLNSFFIL